MHGQIYLTVDTVECEQCEPRLSVVRTQLVLRSRDDRSDRVVEMRSVRAGACVAIRMTNTERNLSLNYRVTS